MLVGSLGFVPVAMAQDVSVDYDKKYDFSKLKTYSVQFATKPANPLAEKRIVAEVEEALTARGWTKAAPASADAVVMLHAASEDKKSLSTFYSGGMGYGWRYGGGMGTAQTSVHEYRVGTLVVDIFDAKSKELLFRGTATDELSDKPEKNEKKVEKATAKMFKDFPPGSAKK
jgi:hypothetical protein